MPQRRTETLWTSRHPWSVFYSKRQIKTRVLGEKHLVQLKDLEVLEEINHGSSGTVYRCKWEGEVMAVKSMPRSGDPETMRKVLMDLEVIRMSSSCPHIVRFYGYFITEVNTLMKDTFNKKWMISGRHQDLHGTHGYLLRQSSTKNEDDWPFCKNPREHSGKDECQRGQCSPLLEIESCKHC